MSKSTYSIFRSAIVYVDERDKMCCNSKIYLRFRRKKCREYISPASPTTDHVGGAKLPVPSFLQRRLEPIMDTSAPKHAHTSFSTPAPRSPFRRRRIIWALLTVFAVVFFFGAPWELPARGLGSSVSRANIAQLVKQKQWQPEEVYGLLHMVTNAEMEGQVLSHDSATDPRKPMELSVYNAGKEGNWKKYVAELEEKYPVVVFSKVSLERREWLCENK